MNDICHTAALTGDPRLDALYAATKRCDVCDTRPHTQLARWSDLRVCDGCYDNEPEPEEEGS